MKCIPLNNIRPSNAQLRLVRAYEYSNPTLRTFIVDDRHHNAFLYIAKGAYRYTFNRRSVIWQDNCFAFLPRGSSYSYEVLSPKVDVHQIEFDLTDPETGEAVTCAENPFLLSDDTGNETRLLLLSVCAQAVLPYPAAEWEALGSLNRLMSSISQAPVEPPDSTRGRVLLAQTYMQHHFMESFDIQVLLNITDLSAAQFRRVFLKTIGIQPHQYHTQLRMNAACKMLRCSESSISEIAQRLGFDSIFAFSQAFSRFKGLSPSEYRKNK